MKLTKYGGEGLPGLVWMAFLMFCCGMGIYTMSHFLPTPDKQCKPSQEMQSIEMQISDLAQAVQAECSLPPK